MGSVEKWNIGTFGIRENVVLRRGLPKLNVQVISPLRSLKPVTSDDYTADITAKRHFIKALKIHIFKNTILTIMYRGIFIFIFLMVLNVYAFGQNLANEKPTYISIKDGLPDASITAVCQDEDGFLWVGTSYGLSRYDGVEFKNYYHSKTGNTISGNYITALQILPGNQLLIATTTGLSLFNIRQNTFKNLVIRAGSRMFAVENSFNAIATGKNGHIWAGSQTCLYELDTALRILQSKNGYNEKDIDTKRFLYVESIKPLPDGKVLFRLQGIKANQYHLYSPVTKKIIPLEEDNLIYKKILDPVRLTDIVFDKGGNAWFIKHLVDSLFFFDHRLNSVTATPLDNIEGKNQIYYNSHLSMINDHLLGCSLIDGGLLYEDESTANDNRLKLKWGIALPGKHVLCTFYDREHNLWLGTTNGLFKFTLASNSLALSALPENNALTGRSIELAGIFIAPGKIFLTTSGGGIFYTGNGGADWKNLMWRSSSELNDTWNVRAINNGSYWIGTQRGLFKWRPGDKLAVPVSLPPAWGWVNALPITTQATDRENVLWMGLGNGVGVAAYNLTNHDFRSFSGQDHGNFPLRYPVTLAEDEFGDMWMGGVEGKGLVRWDRKTGHFSLFSPEFNTDFDNGILNDIYADHEGSLWLGTAGGLYKFNILNKKFKKFDIPQGLSSNTIYSLTADNAKHLWIGTKNGLSCMDMATGKIFNFTGYYQYSEDPVNSVKYDAGSNKIYFITAHNFYSLTPDEWLRRRQPPHLFITSVTSSGKNSGTDHNIVLQYNDNNINIAYTAVNLVDGSQNKYFYSLNNQGKNWISAGSSRQVSFSSLLPGQYTFRVRAQLSDGTWSKDRGVVLFSVAPPFWKSWLFIVSNIAVAAFIIYLLYLYRIRQIMKLQTIRSRIASDLHDDIGSTLSNIHILTELSHANLGEPEKANGFLARIAEEVNSSSQSLDDIVWSINTLNDNFEQIAARMRRHAAELFENSNIKYKVYFDEKLSQKKINMEQRRDIYLIFKEALHNIYKHAQAQSVTIKLETERQYFKMNISDDGLGFDPSGPTARNGLKNIKARVKKGKGIFTVESEKGKGTTLFITMQIFH